MIPTLNPYAISLIALSNPNAVAATPPAQAATQRPAPPAGKSEMPRQRDKRDRDQPEKGEGERGHSTDLVV
ncbi:MAG: hypothetical protein HY060_06605 [Proteobacteria bacterium]|nr:hypothetical protein [Pseudomonadota bacterium]